MKRTNNTKKTSNMMSSSTAAGGAGESSSAAVRRTGGTTPSSTTLCTIMKNDRDAARSCKNKRKKSQHADAAHMQHLHGYYYYCQQQHEGHEVPPAPKMSKSPQQQQQQRTNSKMRNVAATVTAITTTAGRRQEGDQHDPMIKNSVFSSSSFSFSSALVSCPSSGKGHCNCCSAVYPTTSTDAHGFAWCCHRHHQSPSCDDLYSYQQLQPQSQPQPFVLRQQQEYCNIFSIDGVKDKNSQYLSCTSDDNNASSTGRCKNGPRNENSCSISSTAAGRHQQHSMHHLSSFLNRRQSCGRSSWVVPTSTLVQTLQYDDNCVEQQQGLRQIRSAVENNCNSEEDAILKWASITGDVLPSSPTNLNESMTLMDQEENGLLLDSELDVTLQNKVDGMDLDSTRHLFDDVKQVTNTVDSEQLFVDSIIAAEEVMPALSTGESFRFADLNPSSEYYKEGCIQTSKDAKSNNMKNTNQPVVGRMLDTNSTQYYPDGMRVSFRPLSTDVMSKPNNQHLNDETNNREMWSNHLVNYPSTGGNRLFEYNINDNIKEPRYSSDFIQDAPRELRTYPYPFTSSFAPSTDDHNRALDKSKISTRSDYSANFVATDFNRYSSEFLNKKLGSASKEYMPSKNFKDVCTGEHGFCSAAISSSCNNDDSVSKSVNLCKGNNAFALLSEEQEHNSTGYYFCHPKTSSQASGFGNYVTSTNQAIQQEGNTVQRNYAQWLDPEVFCLLQHQRNNSMPSNDHIPILARPNYFDRELLCPRGYKGEVIRFDADDKNAEEDQHRHPVTCQNPPELSVFTTSNHTSIPYVTGPNKNNHSMQIETFNRYAPSRSNFPDSLSPETTSPPDKRQNSPLMLPHQAKLPPHYTMRKVVPLSTKNDKKWLSEFQCFIRSQCMEVFSASSNDVASRMSSKRVSLNQVGIRCRFCAHLPHHERSIRSSSFPSSISKLYQCATMMLRDHFPRCKAIPPSVLHHYIELKEESKKEHSAPDSKSYWMKSAREKLGLIDTDNGIRYRLGTRRNSK